MTPFYDPATRTFHPLSGQALLTLAATPFLIFALAITLAIGG